MDFYTDLYPAVLALWVALAGTYARPLSPARRIAQWATYAIIAVSIGLQAARSIGFDTLWYNWSVPVLQHDNAWYNDAMMAAALLCALLAIQASRGAERRRCAWTLLPLAVLLVPVVMLVRLHLLVTSAALNADLGAVNVALQFLAPVALAYAALSRRIIDIGFVLNQAAVFSGVSIIVVGLFVLGEWVLGNWFSQVSHMTNLEISAGLALALGFSVRAIHARVERVLDKVFFRKRHEDETAIRNFADEATDATDAVTLVRRTKETLETHTDAAFVTVVLDDGTGRYGEVSENDPAIVALHDRHTALDLATLSTQLEGDVAYPMIARGKLVGALVLGPRRSGESYAPDESHAIMQLAREVGAALHNLTLAKILQEHHLPA